ncbi:PEP-CTERM sorting domain-containing protein [Leptothoe spongobia]|uniref:PEP-CTERM sorting domain-containing protein n=1 Tax=Leptothoe spongobia TAU-MAC 1115 TaxID=1967444 RepID=A0A947DDB2_9CYAN|nr:PEP-CTERM sorting domain-containing protein [Leptothoe spongobia]MBT9314882.1 PEP-CTERM sorting domain-containing protein [Leptothoe spongobia TAU-MAC 1115]
MKIGITRANTRLGQVSFAMASIAATLTFFGPATSAQANTFINFEDAPALGLSDNQLITNQYLDLGFSFDLDNNLDGIADVGIAPALEKTGDDRKNGFFNAGKGNDVAEASFFDEENNITYVDRLGNYFLRTGGLGGNGGNLLISYTEGTSAASGELWDIDGNQGFFADGSARTEKWEVQLLDNDGSILDTIFSPLGDTAHTPLDGKPWLWSFKRDSADVKAIRFVFAGKSPAQNVGLAFDNFSSFSSEGEETAVPEPAAMLGLLTMAGFGISSLRRQEQATD